MKRFRQLCVRSRQPVPPAVLEEWLRRPATAGRLAPPWAPGAAGTSGFATSALFNGWDHDQRIAQDVDGAGALLEDQLRVPGGTAASPGTEGPLRMLVYRHRQLARDLQRHAGTPSSAQVIAVTGASGFIGRALTAFLASGGHQVRRLVRRAPSAGSGLTEIAWDPQAGTIEADKLAGVDAVVHLAGESVAGGRWTDARKARIRSSRVTGTALLARTLAAMARPPRVFVSASAVGYYGFERGEPADESAPRGADFLAEVAAEWEAAAAPAAAAGIRLCHPRFSNVLDPRGGALAKLLPIYKAGLGGKLGDGRQAFPWVSLDDAVGALYFGLFDESLAGPYNVVAPEAVSNAAFSAALAAAAERPNLFVVPGWALKLAFGELARSLLSGPEIRPARLLAAGFRFHHPRLAAALAEMLGTFPLPDPSLDGDRLEVDAGEAAAVSV